MTEKYLHYLWDKKTYPIINHPIQNGQSISVLDYGIYNINDSGPDFKFGCVQFDNVQMHGHIEMHLKSSDWYKHKHHHDVNYNNVILHVVYENDIEVVQNGFTLPFIELKHFITSKGFQTYNKGLLSKSAFPCQRYIGEIDSVYFNSMLIRAVEEKFSHKVKFMVNHSLWEPKSVLYVFLGQAFGTNVNKTPFEELVKTVSYNDLAKLPTGKRKAFLLSLSGIIQQESLLSNRSQSIWQFKGTRPNNSPSIRVRQFAELVASFNFSLFNDVMDVQSIKQTFVSEIERVWSLPNNEMQKPSRQMINLLLINSIAPYFWFYGEYVNNEFFQELAIDLLVSIPSEKNSILRKWKELDIKPKNAFESQGLIALYGYYCCRKKCLSCTVGQKVLNR